MSETEQGGKPTGFKAMLNKAKEAETGKDAESTTQTEGQKPEASATDIAKLSEGNAAGGTDTLGDNSPKALQARLDQSKNLEEAGKGYNAPAEPPVTREDIVETDDAKQKNEFVDMLKTQSAAEAGVAKSEGTTTYTSHPIMQLHIGPYHFDKGILKLTAEQVPAFEKLLDSMPITESRTVAKLDHSKVDAIARTLPAATQQFDSSVGRDQLEQLRKTTPILGTARIGTNEPGAHVSQGMDDNLEMVVKPPVDESGNA